MKSTFFSNLHSQRAQSDAAYRRQSDGRFRFAQSALRSQRAQSEAVFMLLIGAIMGLLILGIILTALDYFSGQRSNVSERRLFEGFTNAYEKVSNATCDPSLVVEENLYLSATEYSQRSFASSFDILPECISFDAPPTHSLIQYDPSNPGLISIKEPVQTTVYFQCTTVNVTLACPINCLISFNRKIPTPESCP